MDAETRHSLKQNELAQALSKLRDFNLDAGTRRLLLIILAVLLVLVAWRVWRWSANSASEVGWKDLQSFVSSAATTPDVAIDNLRGLTSSSNPGLKHTARFFAAAILCDKADKDAANFVSLLNQAAGELKTIIDSPDANGFHISAAAFRLASVYESLRNFGEARRAYQLLIDDPRCAGQGFRELARSRLDSLAGLETPVVLTPGDAPPPPELTGPPQPSIPVIDVSKPRPTRPPPGDVPPPAPGSDSPPAEAPGAGQTPAAPPAAPPVEPPATQPGGPGRP
ncbi:hypothetical protein RAS1_34240 [Phycisphaerae bacterium RAS1]|nr:hypothetical protein RAS1_34240 [Phycisphaerae bacterium RAS1]